MKPASVARQRRMVGEYRHLASRKMERGDTGSGTTLHGEDGIWSGGGGITTTTGIMIMTLRAIVVVICMRRPLRLIPAGSAVTISILSSPCILSREHQPDYY